MKTKRLFIALAALVVPAASMAAVTFTATGTDAGYNLAAKAVFSYSAGVLTVSLTNTAADPADVPSHTLSGVYWNLLGAPALTKNGVALGGGSTIVNPDGGTFAKKYGFKSSITNATLGVTNAYGLSSTGLGIFGKSEQFDSSGSGGSQIQGDDYNLISAAGHANQPFLNSNPLVQDTVVFNLNVASLNESDISNVVFHYGSALDDPTIKSVPEPATMALLGLGALGFARRRKA